MKSTAPRLAALAGLQFLAALHILFFYDAPAHFDMAAPLRNIVGAGWTSFSLLFVLTGFLTAYNFTDRSNGRRMFYAHEFYGARIARLAPLYLIALLIALVPIVRRILTAEDKMAALPTAVVNVVLSATTLHAWVPASASAVNAAAWCVSVAVLFFFLYPRLYVKLARRTGPGLLVAAAALWVVSMVLVLGAQEVVSRTITAGAKTFPRLWLDGLAMNPLLRLPELVIGALVGRWFVERGRDEDVRAVAAPLAIGSLVVLLGAMAMGPVLPPLVHHTSLLVPVEAALIVGLAAGAGALGSLLSSRAMVYLGSASFALVILQGPVHDLLRTVTAGAGVGMHRSPMWTMLFFPAALIAALVAHAVIESPLRKVLFHRLAPPRHKDRIPLIIGQRHTIDAMEGEGTWDSERETADRRSSRYSMQEIEIDRRTAAD